MCVVFVDGSAVDSFVEGGALRRFCRRAALAATDDIRDGTRTSDANFRSGGDFVGLGCRTNRSVSFYAMDRRSLYGAAFLRNTFGESVAATLAADAADEKTDQSSVAVVDVKV